MPLSMTAFARAECTTPWGRLVWELRSVNHRYLELSLRLPEEFRFLETEIRAVVGATLNRGKVDLGLRFQAASEQGGEFSVDSDLLTRLLDSAQAIQAQSTEPLAGLAVADLLRWPGVLRTPEIDTETRSATCLDLLKQALNELVATREREGARLGELISERARSIAERVGDVRAVLPDIAAQYRQRLRDRLEEVRTQVDESRLEQEMVLFAQKTDVAEELDRLLTHTDEVKRVLAGNKPMGRRLDFLMQELNREANTLGSKATDIRLTNAGVDIKVLIEQMREQIQNIE